MQAKRFFHLLLWLLAAFSMLAHADSYRDFNVRIAKNYLIPRYQTLAEATGAQYAVLQKFCAAPDAAGLEAARTAFHRAVDAWMAIQHIRLGPVALAFRRERIAHWPEHRNAIGNELRQRLAGRDRAALEAQSFARSSVAIQGLPALERLLFEQDSLAKYTATGATARYRCELTLAIGRNLATIAGELISEWRDDMLPALASGEAHPIYFDSPKGATRLLLTDLQTLLQTVIDLKLEKVIGKDTDKAKPKLAENYRSGRSLRNIVINLETAAEMYGGEGGFGEFIRAEENGETIDQQLYQGFEQALSSVRKLPPLEEAATDPNQRRQLNDTIIYIKAVRNEVITEVPKAADVKLGFNELDGD
jgi:predicted lipoprotein